MLRPNLFLKVVFIYLLLSWFYCFLLQGGLLQDFVSSFWGILSYSTFFLEHTLILYFFFTKYRQYFRFWFWFWFWFLVSFVDSAEEFLLLFVEVKSINKLEMWLSFSSAGCVVFFDQGVYSGILFIWFISNSSRQGFSSYFLLLVHQVQTVLLVSPSTNGTSGSG